MRGDGGEVGFEQSGNVRRLGDRADHVVGNGAAHPVMRNVLPAAFSDTRLGDCFCAAVDMTDGGGSDGAIDVFAGDAAIAASAVYAGGIDIVLEERTADGGRKPALSLVRAERSRSTFSHGPFDYALRAPLSADNGAFPLSIDPPEHRARDCFGIGTEQYLRQHARRRRGHFLRDLVGFEFDQRIVHRHRVARLLEPGANHCFGAFLFVGDADIDHSQNPTRRSISARIRATLGTAASSSEG